MDSDSFSCKIGQCLDITIRAHHDHFIRIEVRPGPLKAVFLALHRDTGPHAVDLAVCQSFVRIFPVDHAENDLIPHPAERFGCQFHIDSHRPHHGTQVAVRFITIRANDDLGQVVRLVCRRIGTGRQKKNRSQQETEYFEKFFRIHPLSSCYSAEK